jgi:hypothetical protein
MADFARRSRTTVLALVLAFAGATACGSDLTLPPATIPIAQQQIKLYALTGTPVGTSSAYDMLSLAEVRTDVSTGFDFAFDMVFDSAYGFGQHNDTVAVLIPRGALGFTADPGLQVVPTFNFDSLKIAAGTGYTKARAVRIHEGDVLFAASRAQSCNFGFIRPHYAKLLIQAIDLNAKMATILVIIDPNCGYQGLGSGIPTQ